MWEELTKMHFQSKEGLCAKGGNSVSVADNYTCSEGQPNFKILQDKNRSVVFS